MLSPLFTLPTVIGWRVPTAGQATDVGGLDIYHPGIDRRARVALARHLHGWAQTAPAGLAVVQPDDAGLMWHLGPSRVVNRLAIQREVSDYLGRQRSSLNWLGRDVEWYGLDDHIIHRYQLDMPAAGTSLTVNRLESGRWSFKQQCHLTSLILLAPIWMDHMGPQSFQIHRFASREVDELASIREVLAKFHGGGRRQRRRRMPQPVIAFSCTARR